MEIHGLSRGAQSRRERGAQAPTVDTCVLSEGLGFPESPRWHDGAWWVSDLHRRHVLSVDSSGASSVVAEVPGRPSGLGWLADGRLVVVSMADRRLWYVEAGGRLALMADLGAVAQGPSNDMVVGDDDCIYVGHFGHWDGRQYSPAPLALVRWDGEVSVAVAGLEFPNGMVVTPDGSTIICAETYGHRLTAWTRRTDGGLACRRLWADMGAYSPDGMCLDSEGAVWVADPFHRVVLRVSEGGEVLDRIEMGDRGAYACALGGPAGRTLLICSNVGDVAAAYNDTELRMGRLETVVVDVPAVGHE
jgi:sugar lactone lactonase YvrE